LNRKAYNIMYKEIYLDCYYPAEEYHQDYLDKNPLGYCHLSPELFEMAKSLNR